MVKADRSLEERIKKLEKQLTEMQAAMSCKLVSSIDSINILELKNIACRIGPL